MYTLKLDMAEMIVANGQRLEKWQVKELIRDYQPEEFSEPLRAYIDRFVAGIPYRRGRPRSSLSLEKVKRRINILLDYDLALSDFLHADKHPQPSSRRRRPVMIEKTARDRALGFIRARYSWRADLPAIANRLTQWRSHEVIRRVVGDMLCDRAGIKRRRRLMLVELTDPSGSPTSNEESES